MCALFVLPSVTSLMERSVYGVQCNQTETKNCVPFIDIRYVLGWGIRANLFCLSLIRLYVHHIPTCLASGQLCLYFRLRSNKFYEIHSFNRVHGLE